MRNVAIAAVVILSSAEPATSRAQEDPRKPAATKAHEWLLQFVGEWESEADSGKPGQPKVTEKAHMLGGLWLVSETKVQFADKPPMLGMLTIGYDPEKKKYVGTWIDSMTSYLWKYEGTVDSNGKALTLATEGPNPMAPGKLFAFQDVHEFTDSGHKVMTSSMRDANGKWHPFQVVKFRRKK
jgi:Protein of unknown function (DUF1579)